MSYIAPEIVAQAKQMDLLTYLKNYEPYELVKLSGNIFTTKTHDSLKISNGKWMWWSRGIGGRSALDYLIKVKNLSFTKAVKILADQAAIRPLPSFSAGKKEEKKLLLPKQYQTADYVVAYLKRRGIDEEIIQFCLQTGRLYESANYHNAVFAGLDANGTARYAALRGVDTDFIGEASGSDKNFSFSIPADRSCKNVHLFESAIDLISYATLLKLAGKDWQSEHLLSLAGVYQPAKDIENSKVPAALTHFLSEHTEVTTIIFHLDRDHAGRQATKAISMVLPKQYLTWDEPPPVGKDFNDYLCIRKGLKPIKRIKNNYERRNER